ncbi:MAG TPA: RluA family pseudouridine synthase [Tepidisphaeraceae bacterium]|jgi:23S rRNA pseudouridine1911/1915/1917 synthase|nr:RluA family pseudouridine synthase [Tepidisphaeraceae bacterium]
MPDNLLQWLTRKYPLAKRQTFKRMVESRRVRINGRAAVKLNQPLAPDDQIEVRDPTPLAPPAKLPGLIFEDDDILVVDKPAGLLTSTVARERRPTLLARVRQYVAQSNPQSRVGLIHRLDRDASGLIVFSKNERAFRSLKNQFFDRTAGREYRAVAHGTPDPPVGRIQTNLVERADGTVHSTRQAGKGEVAVTHYRVLRNEKKLSLLRVLLETGRKHQIRAHLAERGNPIVGDKMYGTDETAPRLMLAAVRLTIAHPRDKRQMTFAIPVPSDFPVQEKSDQSEPGVKAGP